MTHEISSGKRRLRQFGWLVLLWAGGVAALGVFALLLRLVMKAIGMTA